MLARFYLWAWNLIYKNRLTRKPGNELALPADVARKMKRVTIKLGGRNNRLVLGEGAEINDCEIRLDGENNLIEIGPRVRIKSGKIYLRHTHDQHIRIGADTTVEGVYMLSDEAASIDIGQDCMFSTGILIRTGDKHSILDAATGRRINPARSVRIGNRVWLGREAQVLKGAVLLPETVVGAGSLVSGVFEEGCCVVAGVPARVIKRGIRWDRELV